MGDEGIPEELYERPSECPNCETGMGRGEPRDKKQIPRRAAEANDWPWTEDTLFVCDYCYRNAPAPSMGDFPDPSEAKLPEQTTLDF